ncbi:hypothetical protein WR25_20661 isoform A [Diploscapter pachys]|uniref:U1 small nuclear ribonucleoprotein C n=2 Tax=Diploscapter pachys TaxID=2018661 RepID=A0A2A2L2U6_9BILA|nr:hypothetical protein WR25_20661 isoform A [Diploscapter pachys]
MPKYYCDYCDVFLTHDSPSVRKTHNGGRKHKENVRMYYQKWMEDQAQKLIDETAKAFASNVRAGQTTPAPNAMPSYAPSPGRGTPMLPPMGVGRPIGGVHFPYQHVRPNIGMMYANRMMMRGGMAPFRPSCN